MEHNHADTNYHVTTCERCAREWAVIWATAADPLTVFPEEVLFPPSDTLPHRLLNLFVPIRIRILALALWWKLKGKP